MALGRITRRSASADTKGKPSDPRNRFGHVPERAHDRIRGTGRPEDPEGGREPNGFPEADHVGPPHARRSACLVTVFPE